MHDPRNDGPGQAGDAGDARPAAGGGEEFVAVYGEFHDLNPSPTP